MFYLGPFGEDLVIKEKPCDQLALRFSDLVTSNSISVDHESESLVRQIGGMGHSSGTNFELCYWFCIIKLRAVLISESL